MPDGSTVQDCVWTGEDGDNKVVIGLRRVPLAGGCDRLQRGKCRGIMFNRSPAKGTSPPVKYGKMCLKVCAPTDGGIISLPFQMRSYEHYTVSLHG